MVSYKQTRGGAMRYIRFFVPLLLLVVLVLPASAQYYKSDKGLMVHVLIRYAGSDTSPYITNDKIGIASKEATATRLGSLIQSAGGKIGYSFHNVNMIS